MSEIMQDSTILSKCNLLLKCNKALLNKNVTEGPSFARLSVFANTPASEANIGALVVRLVIFPPFCLLFISSVNHGEEHIEIGL